MWVRPCGCACVKFYMCACRRVVVGVVVARGCWSHLSMVIKAGAVVTKLSPYAWLLSAASILREQQTHYREGREKKRKKGSGKRERGWDVGCGGGGTRPVAEGLILNVLQRQCLLSSLASPLTAPASKQDLSALPPPNRKTGRKQERQWELKMTVLLPNAEFAPKSSTTDACHGQPLSFLLSFVSDITG